jgi:tRNA U54 and U55 pseudouridine synthase Pus10
LEEKKEIPKEFAHYEYKASGFMPPKLIKDCPIRLNLVTLSVKCRRWDVLIDGKYHKRSRNWESVAKGTRLNPEYASFLKEIGGL